MSQPPYSSPPSYQILGPGQVLRLPTLKGLVGVPSFIPWPTLSPSLGFSIGLVGKDTRIPRSILTPNAAISNGPTAAFAPAFPSSKTAATTVNPYTTQNQIYSFFKIVNPNAPTQ